MEVIKAMIIVLLRSRSMVQFEKELAYLEEVLKYTEKYEAFNEDAAKEFKANIATFRKQASSKCHIKVENDQLVVTYTMSYGAADWGCSDRYSPFGLKMYLMWDAKFKPQPKPKEVVEPA